MDEETLEELSTMEDDKILFKAADKNLDNKLSSEEFFTFTNPNIGMMYPVLFTALAAKDQNKDGRISVQELISNCESSKSNDWKAFERKRFNEDLEIHKDGVQNCSLTLHFISEKHQLRLRTPPTMTGMILNMIVLPGTYYHEIK